MKKIVKIAVVTLCVFFSHSAAVAQCKGSAESSKEDLKKLLETGGGIMGVTYVLAFKDGGVLAISTKNKNGKVLKAYEVDLTRAKLGENIIVYHNTKSEPDEFTLKFKKSITSEVTKKGKKPIQFLLAGNKMDERIPEDFMNFGKDLEKTLKQVVCWSKP